MIRALLLLWQLPQLLLGLLVALVLRARRAADGIWRCAAPIGVSFGPVIILWSELHLFEYDKAACHERGHSRQSELLGPLYLIMVGIPSLTMNVLTQLGILRASNYYKRWPESWADQLGGVKR